MGDLLSLRNVDLHFATWLQEPWWADSHALPRAAVRWVHAALVAKRKREELDKDVVVKRLRVV